MPSATEDLFGAPAAVQESGAMATDDGLLAQHLDVYDTRAGPWNPEHGELQIPEDWELLPSGDTFLTRTVKANGPYWLAWKPRTRQRPHRRLVGVWAPKPSIDAARAAALASEQRRDRQRRHGEASRQRREATYQAELRGEVLRFLDFHESHRDLAERIADEAAARAAVVGSGRVGRTRTITIEERAALAARALIRHRFTSYEDDLVEVWDDDFLYREVKADAQSRVDAFLERHRGPHPSQETSSAPTGSDRSR